MKEKLREDFYYDCQMTAYAFWKGVFGDDEGFNQWFYHWGFSDAINDAIKTMFDARREETDGN